MAAAGPLLARPHRHPALTREDGSAPDPLGPLTTPAATGGRRGAWRWLPAFTSIACLGAGVWWSLRQGAPTFPRADGAGLWVGAGVLIYAMVTLLRAERWHRILRGCGLPAGRADAYALTTVGYMGNNVLPARGGEVLRVLLLATRLGTERRRVLGTLVVERALDAAALGILFLGFSVDRLGSALPAARAPVILVLAAGLGLAAGLAVVAVRRRRTDPRVRRAIDLARPVWAAAAAVRGWPGVLLLGLSLALWLLEATVYLAVAAAIGLDLGFGAAIGVMAFTNFAGILPAGPGYIGTFDGAVLVAVRAFGVRGGAGLTYLLLLRFVLFVPITLVGLILLLSRYGGWKTLRARRQLIADPAAG